MAQSIAGLLWTPATVARFSGAGSPEEAIRLVGALLVSRGAVTASHVEAAILREGEHPTGLPAEVPFALVHTDEPGALQPAAALGIFDRPVPFKRMDDPAEQLPLRLVVMLSVPDRESQAETLSRLVSTLANPKIAERLLAAPADTAFELLCEVQP